MAPDLTSGWRPLVHKLNPAGTDTELIFLHGKGSVGGEFRRWFQMSALGQKQTCDSEIAMSALPPKADISRVTDVRFVPKADIFSIAPSPFLAAELKIGIKLLVYPSFDK